jgi:hypothetical protein
MAMIHDLGNVSVTRDAHPVAAVTGVASGDDPGLLASGTEPAGMSLWSAGMRLRSAGLLLRSVGLPLRSVGGRWVRVSR